MKVEQIQSSDYDFIIGKLNEWWGGRNMVEMLPRLFFKYFSNTSLIIKDKNLIIGFIIGFVSQTEKTKAYVHFIGVNPTMRGKQVGKNLYTSFFEIVRKLGIKEVECVTSITNERSIEFHKKTGFTIVKGDSVDNRGVPYFSNYDGPGENRVLFKYTL